MLLGPVPESPAGMVPDAPVENFRLPMFSPEGFRTWQLQGAEARYISNDQLDVTGLHLRIFSGNADELLRSVIRSPEATVFIRQHEARGEHGIDMTGDNFQAHGKHWHWQWEEDRVFIREEVEVIFHEAFEGFLSPFP